MTDLFTELLDSLNDLPISENYTAKDRHNDFRQIFTGSDQGKRVYRELISWGKLFSPSIHGTPIDPYHMAIIEGQRNYVAKLMAAVNIDPPEQPTKVSKKYGRSTT